MAIASARQVRWSGLLYGLLIVFACPMLVIADDDSQSEEREKGRYGKVELLKTCNPKYPRQALLDRIEGFVRYGFTITKEGIPESISVLKSSPPGVFDEAGMTAIGCFRFAPRDTERPASYTLEWNLE